MPKRFTFDHVLEQHVRYEIIAYTQGDAGIS